MRLPCKRDLLFLAAVGFLLAPPFGSARAQEPPPIVLTPPAPGKIQRLTLKDGSQLLGKIVEVTPTTVKFESSLGVTEIPIASIQSVREESPGQTREGKYYFPNPNATRLIFSPTGRMLEKGEGYFSDYWIFFPGIAVGVTDRFTMGGGMSIFPEVALDDQVLYITPKVGIIQRPNFNVAVGALAASVPSDEDHNTAGILYGVSTWGDRDASFTTGVGYGFVNGKLADRPIVMLGGEARASPRISFVTENYFFPGGASAISGGIRFMGRDLSVDLALAGISGDGDSLCCLPFLGFVWKW